jgi:hypothetical protein
LRETLDSDIIASEEFFDLEISDEALEALDNGGVARADTFGPCTGLSFCPIR